MKPAVSTIILFASALSVFPATAQQPAFAVATIRPSAAQVQFEHDGKTDILPDTLRMRDVTLNTCIKLAYGVQDSQISGPGLLRSEHYDISAKTDAPVDRDQMKLMLQTLLADRFRLSFHRENRELKGFALIVVKGGPKFHEATGDGETSRQNTATGTIAKSITMREFADFLSGPVEAPIVDKTGLPGKYDFTLDFTSYLPPLDRPTKIDDFLGVMQAALEGELGLKLEPRKKETIEVLVVDHVEKPSEN
jgi:uncharacterized protein (TIGR03435 family)